MSSESNRPTLDLGGAVSASAATAVTELVEELQAGWARRDADASNRHFAADILWGSPFGATVHGYRELHAIHVRLKEQGMGGPSSRFEVVRVLAPTPDVAIAQVRRVALDDRGQAIEPSETASGSFSELAMYVLVRRGSSWWLAAGQNTPMRPQPRE